MIPAEITQDLREGMGLEECLIKHQTNLKTVLQGTNIKKLPPTKARSPVTYILERNGTYLIRKKLKRKNKRSKTYVFGVYNSREDAETIRDELIQNGWKQKSVERLCQKHGIERHKGKHEERYRGA